MAAMIKMYTWWTIRRHKKEQAYKLVAIARRTEVSGSGRADGDVLEMVTVTDATAWKKMKGGAVVFGILPQNFSRDFKFAELKNDNVPGSLRAEMHGAFSLNFDDPESLGAFLFYLPQICQNTKVKNEWDADEIAALLADCEDAVKAGLQTAVKAQTAHDLISLGDSGLGEGRAGTPSENYYREFPAWLKVQKLYTKFTYSEPAQEAEAAKAPEPDEVNVWEKSYNHNVEALERKQLEDALKIAVSTQALDQLVKEQQLALAKMEAERNFWRAKHSELAAISDIFSDYRRRTYLAYAQILLFFADHPILSPIVLLIALLAYNYIVTEYVPQRVCIRISGDSSAAESMKEALRAHFENEKETKDGLPVYLVFSNTEDGFETKEFPLREKQIERFERSLDRFINTHRSFVDKRHSGAAASSFLDGGVNFIFKKKIYTIPVKADDAAMDLKVVLMGKNSIGGDLQTFLMDEFAVDKVARSDNSFTFKLRHGTTIDKLKAAIKRKFPEVTITGRDREIIIDASQAAATNIILDVRNLSPKQKSAIGRIFNVTILGENRVTVIGDRKQIGDRLEEVRTTLVEYEIGGEWDSREPNTYVFSKAVFTYTVLGGARDPETVKALEKSDAFVKVIETRIGAKQGPKYPYALKVQSYVSSAGELRGELKKTFPDSDSILIDVK